MRQLLNQNRAWTAPVTGLLANRYVGDDKPIDVKLGMALLRDRRVPVAPKLLALAAGIGVIALLEVLEIPAEMLLSALLPVIGFGISVAVNGLEYIAGSLLLMAAIVPHLAPKNIVARIRAERKGPIPIRVTADH